MSGAANTDAAAGADVVVLAVPYDGHDDLVASLADQLAGKVVISCVNPLGFDKQGPYGLDVARRQRRRDGCRAGAVRAAGRRLPPRVRGDAVG